MKSIDSEELLQGHNDLRSIYSICTRYWGNGEKNWFFVPPDNYALHKTFVKQKQQKIPHQLRRTWDRATSRNR